MHGRDFDDDISDMLGGEMKPRPLQERLPDTRSNDQKLADHFEAQGPDRGSVFNEKCPKCGGGGFWKGNRRFPCFACKGRGTLSFKTSPEARRKARIRGAEKAVERENAKTAWRHDHLAEIGWTQRAAAWNSKRGGTFDFPQKLLEALDEYGTWTDGQLAAVQKLMAREQERRAENKAKRSSAIDATRVEAAFASAREHSARAGMQGIFWTRPVKLRAREIDLTFQQGSEGSQWSGMIFVKAGEKKLGAIKAGVFTRRFECSDAEAAAVTEACSDPHQAAVAFGKAWGVCTVCGRTLTDDQSIARGIGPICAENFGW